MYKVMWNCTFKTWKMLGGGKLPISWCGYATILVCCVTVVLNVRREIHNHTLWQCHFLSGLILYIFPHSLNVVGFARNDLRELWLM